MSHSRGRLSLIVASRIFLPEPAAASFRLGAVCKALEDEGALVRVLTTTPAPSARSLPATFTYSVSRWPALRDATGYIRGYLPYMSFDLPLFFRLLAARRPDVVLVEPPPTTGAVTRVAATLRRFLYVWYAADL